jgi:asparagine synthase (glutamine-hydrolysing)
MPKFKWMCAIAGFVTRSPDSPPEAILTRTTDACGYYRDAFASLGHRRLSIIDLATGDQPMTNEDGSLWITYNGEIFNHAALRPALDEAGHRYGSHCDTEAILRGHLVARES